MTMANITFVGDNALIFYSKSPTKKNLYSLIQQIIPVPWFYQGDQRVVFGKKSANVAGGITGKEPPVSSDAPSSRER